MVLSIDFNDNDHPIFKKVLGRVLTMIISTSGNDISKLMKIC